MTLGLLSTTCPTDIQKFLFPTVVMSLSCILPVILLHVTFSFFFKHTPSLFFFFGLKMDDGAVIVVDNGAFQSRVGFSGDDTPRCEYPSVVGWMRVRSVMPGLGPPDHFVGQDAFVKRSILTYFRRPFEDIESRTWEDVEILWRYGFDNQLKTSPGTFS